MFYRELGESMVMAEIELCSSKIQHAVQRKFEWLEMHSILAQLWGNNRKNGQLIGKPGSAGNEVENCWTI